MQNLVAEISLKRIVSNAREVIRRAKKPLIAVVKDDAYGHGAVAVAQALSPVAAGFAVATADEGAALRVGGIEAPILVLTPALCAEEAVRIDRYGLTASVTSLSSLRLLLRTGERMQVHLAVNTGMNRYGFRPSRVGEGCRLALKGGLNVTGVYSHLYLPSEEEDVAFQRARFFEACERVHTWFPAAMRHLSATGGLLAGEDGADAVRVGLALYGYQPAGGDLLIKPAMKIYATVAQSGVPFGRGAGYQRAQKEYRALHTLRLGYGDGFFREGGVGTLCMDACVAEGGSRFGRRKRVLSDAHAYAEAHGTTEYEVLVRVTKRAVKVYV